MTVDDVRTELYSVLQDNWTSTNIAWPNREFNPSSVSAYAKPHILFDRGELAELGESGIGFRYGTFVVQLFVAVNSGDLQSTTYAKTIEALYRRKDLNGVITDEPYTTFVGVDKGNPAFYQTNVVVPFLFFIGE